MLVNFTIYIFLVAIYQVGGQDLVPTKRKIRVGVAAALKTQIDAVGWGYCGGALPLALKRLQDKGYIKDFDIEFVVQFTECDKNATVKAAMEFMKNKSVDVVIGPPCSQALQVMGTLSAIYKIPLLGWGFVTDPALNDLSRYPYMVTLLSNSQTLAYATSKILETYQWNKVALLFVISELNYCGSIMDYVESALNDPAGYPIQVVMKQGLDPNNSDAYDSVMKSIKYRARVLIICARSAQEKRNHMIRVAQLGMDTDEYVHILLSVRSVGFGVQTSVGKKTFTYSGLTPIWETFNTSTDGYEDIARSGASKFMILDVNSDVSDIAYLQYAQSNIVKAVRGPPFNCNYTECMNASTSIMGAFARHLFDAFYLYGVALTNLNTTDPSIYDDVNKIVPQFVTTFDGLTGNVSFSSDLSRRPNYKLYGLDEQYDQVALMDFIQIEGTKNFKVSLKYTDESKSVWYHWGGKRPLTTPICGFTGNSCPLSTWDQFGILIIVLSVVAMFTVFTFIFCFFCLIRSRRAEQARINGEWQIPHYKLQSPEQQPRDQNGRRSSLSSASISSESHRGSVTVFEQNFQIQNLDKEIVLTTNHQVKHLTKQEMEHFVKLHKLEHENINKFIGLSIDGLKFIAVWRLCARGTLQDIISKGNFSMDSFFMLCIIRDVAEGMRYIHHSFLKVHGNMRSGTCLVTDSWQVKLTDYGLDGLQEEETPMKKRQLWIAPEVLRGSLLVSQMEPSADIYSFSIIASEILTKMEAYNLGDRKESFDEIIYRIKKGESIPLRPDLNSVGTEVNPSLTRLVKDCWSENSEDRPTSDEICSLLNDMMPRTQKNLMDHVFNMLEEYATTLEGEVEERTKELTIEKKKADILLGRMLPRQVADKLKQGQTVEPEGFDSVTVFFSDIVKFTQLAAKCSPFQVVNLLNDFFSNIDAIIESHNNYKVESIGDGYLCVSGLPARNGFAHIKQIVDMSLAFMEYSRSFKVPHLAKEKVELRIGINSGPCVAGVVGLSMPRYCLFGDTVNTASRMESNGKPSHIHMSAAAHTLLTSHYPHKYETNSRGEVIIKGKGVMETFWVLSRLDDTQSPDPITRQSTASPTELDRKFSVPSTSSTLNSVARSISPIIMNNNYNNGSYSKVQMDTLKVA